MEKFPYISGKLSIVLVNIRVGNVNVWPVFHIRLFGTA